jgi:hypothetical protein
MSKTDAYEKIPAVIRSAEIGYEGHGILTVKLDLDYGGSSQGVPGYNAGPGSNSLAVVVTALLRLTGADDFSKVAGSHVLVLKAPGDQYGPVLGLAPFLPDDSRVIVLGELAEKFVQVAP